jgi:hypothetical protein
LALKPGRVEVRVADVGTGWVPALDRSSDLSTWEPVGTRTDEGGGSWVLEDPSPTAAGAMYRVRLDKP